MFVQDRMIIDFNCSKPLEAAVLYSFLSEGDNLLFGEQIYGLTAEFIRDRTVISTTQWILDWLPDPHMTVDWYGPTSREEFVSVFQANLNPPYYCVVLPRGKGISEYKYILYAYEHAEFNNRECTAMIVMREHEPGSFEKYIKPVIESL